MTCWYEQRRNNQFSSFLDEGKKSFDFENLRIAFHVSVGFDGFSVIELVHQFADLFHIILFHSFNYANALNSILCILC